VTPPSHINVLRTALGRVETVPFRRYVEIVMAAEWGPENPREALAAGAVAVKQYAWYFALQGNWRGGSSGGRCYDVRDTTADQLYRPGSKRPTARHLAAVAESWAVSLHKAGSGAPGGFFITNYNNGDGYARCGTGRTGHTLRQVGASSCAARGYTFQQILRLYYGPGVRIVAPSPSPHHDLDGRGYGDIGILLDRVAQGGDDAGATGTARTTDALILASNGKRVETRSDQALGFSLDSVLGHVADDLTGDRRADLAVLVDSAAGLQIRVFSGADHGFAPGSVWWEAGSVGPDLANARVELVSAAFDRDRGADLGLVVQDRDGGSPTRVYLLHSTSAGLSDAVLAWEGDPGGILWAAYGGDFTGDGRGDVALIVDAGPGGIRFLVLAGTGSGGALAAPQSWFTDAELTRAAAAPLVADVDGDGRSDIVVVERAGASGLDLAAYQSTGRRFELDVLGHAAEGYPWGSMLIGSSDLDGNGLDDVYVLSPDAGGAKVDAFLSRGSSVKHAAWGTDADLELGSATTY
jgi:hypothetical protein